MLPLKPLVCTPEAVKLLWDKFDSNRSAFGDELPRDPIHFYAWIAAKDARGFLVGEPPLGLFLFTDITAGESAFAHVFLWDREEGTYADRVEAAQLACAAMFRAYDLVRITGLTPATNVAALAFSERVGFKREGRLRRAITQGGLRGDAFLSGMLLEDLEAAMKPADDRMEEKEP